MKCQNHAYMCSLTFLPWSEKLFTGIFMELSILLDSFPMMKIYLNFRHVDILTAKVDI